MKYNKQRILRVSITKKVKRSYYENLGLKDITDSKKFCTTVKSLFSNKTKSIEHVTLEENGKIKSNGKELVKSFNEFYKITKRIKMLDPKKVAQSTFL